MDLQFYGGNCIALTIKGARVIVDDNLADLGAKAIIKPDDIAVFTGAHGITKSTPKLVIDGPGEYEVAGFSIVGIAARAHMDPEGTRNATIYKIADGGTDYLVTGHIYPDLSDEQLEAIGMVDVMVVPVGGNGYTLDPTGALQLIKKIEPKVVVPTHYADELLHYPVEQQSLEDALKKLGMEPADTTTKYRFKPADAANPTTQLIVVAHT